MIHLYVLIDPATEEIRYVGWTSKPLAERLAGHLKDHCRCHRTWWLKSLLRRGFRPRIELVQDVPDEHRHDAERYWIFFFRARGCNLTNSTDGGEGMLGWHPSDETKAKLRAATQRQFADPAARAAVSRVHKGKVISREHRAIVGAVTKKRWEAWREQGLHASETTKEKIRAARTGKPLSEAHRAKVGASLAGKSKSPEHKAKLAEALKKAREAQQQKRQERSHGLLGDTATA